MRGRIGARDARLAHLIPAGTGTTASAPDPYRPATVPTSDSRRQLVDSSSSARLMVIGQPDVQGGLRQDQAEVYRVRTQ